MEQQINQNVVDIFSDFIAIGFSEAATYQIDKNLWAVRGDDHGDIYHGLVTDPKEYKGMTADEIIARTTEISAEFYASTIATKGVM